MKQTLFLDLFGVLLGKDIKPILNYIYSFRNLDKNKIYEIIFGEKYMQLERYEISLNEYCHYVELSINNPMFDIDQLVNYLQTFKLRELPMAKKLEQYKKQANFYILTNTTQAHINKLEKQFSCLKQCQGIITSDLAMAHKPSSKIFYYACEVVDVEPNQSVFIDDTKINVLKAEKLGFNAHHYQSETELNIFLSKLFNLK